MYPILFHIGPFALRAYGVAIATAILVGAAIAMRDARRQRIRPELVQDFTMYAVLAGLAGGRLYYLAFAVPEVFWRAPWEILALWRGGLAIHGALLGGLLVALWYCRSRGIPFWRLADTLAPGLVLGQAIGQIGCFLNGDAYGKPTTLPWGVTFTNPESMAPLGVPLHPTQLYEASLNLLFFGLLWSVRRHTRFEGQLFLIYAAGYAALRFVVEAFRGDQLQFAGGISAAQTLSLMALVASAVLLWHRRRSAAGGSPMGGAR